MTTPLFKLLANSIRLGQPPEPVTAIRALVEVIAHQEAEMNELRQRVSLLTSRLQFFEAKTARLEAVTMQNGPPSSGAPYPNQQESQPFSQQQPSFSGQPAFAPQQGITPYSGLAAPTHLPKADPLPARSERPRSQRPPAFAELQNTDDPRDGEAGGTLVVLREDIDAVVRSVVDGEAPYPIAMPGGHGSTGDHLSGMPFKPAPSQPPPAMNPQATMAGATSLSAMAAQMSSSAQMAAGAMSGQIPQAPLVNVIAHSEELPPKPGVVEKKMPSDAPLPKETPRVPAARESYSDPYVPIEDTFSSTAEVAAVQMPMGPGGELARPERASRRPEPREPAPVARRTGMADEPSFDEVLTSIHKRKT